MLRPRSFRVLANGGDQKSSAATDSHVGLLRLHFTFSNLNRGFYFLTLSGKNYTSKTIPVRLQDNREEQYYLMPTVTVIKTVVVRTEADIILKGDTIQYNADSFKTQANASAEDLVKKLPGVTTENGKVTAQGEEVKRVLVDGKPFSEMTQKLR